MPLVAGVDSSTQSTKVEIRDVDTGEVVGVGRAPHPATEPPRSEQDPRAWWEALAVAFAACGAARSDVAAISVAGQQHGLVVLGDDGAPLRPAKLWNDTESAPEAAALVDRLGAAAWAEACGSVPVASFTITKLAWVANHEPELVARVARVMLPHDYLTWRLTGAHVTDRGDASGGGWYDSDAARYRADLLALVGGRDDWPALLP
ncbi:MAG: xylulose kinase, partial [Actinobacteria bacterium]|nr:xylulose kinase [Actinomycetota bacterium]NIY11966.1 xylulose kinase [Gemmatimonadota bacterium]NIT98200.1 xylulose kinase [Actinomycetota bacterium]NIU21834.1 xylulose kinase [Actinomycetota bacterium]NIU70240.1 xylulose kinase [Actinomycetota bacterium]